MSFITDLIGGSMQQSADNKASQQALTGYNYLTGKNGIQGYVTNGSGANNAEAQLLGLAPESAQTATGFNNYLNSTGYKFNLQQGQDAISGSAAARGILNSGSTGKALTQYGQNLGTSYFNNYLNSLGGVAGQGLQGAGEIGQAGTQGGGNAGAFTAQGGNAMAQGIAGAGGSLMNLFGMI